MLVQPLQLGLHLMLLLGASLLLEGVAEGVAERAAAGLSMWLACRAWWEPSSG